MPHIFMTDRIAGRVAFFLENGTTGDVDDPASIRNAPLSNPGGHLDKLRFHSDLDYLEVSHGPTDVVISHAAVGPGSGPATGMGINNLLFYGGATADHPLLTHSLGYVPDFLVIANGDTLYGGTPVQRLSDGRTRHVTAYATTTQIRLSECAVRTSASMPALDVSYTVIVFRRPPAPSGDILIDRDPATGVVEMGFGKFNSSRRYLQVVAGGTPYGFSQGRTLDLSNGAPRLVDPDGTITDVVPAGTAMAFYSAAEPSFTYGASQAYDGSFAGSPGVLFKVP